MTENHEAVIKSLASASAELQHFVIQLEKGNLGLRSLVLREADLTREAIKVEGNRSRDHTTQQTSILQAAIADSAKDTEESLARKRELEDKRKLQSSRDERLLKSLYWEDMNTRGNSVEDAHHDTFEWILKTKFKDDTDLMSSKMYLQKEIGFTDWLQRGKGIFWINGKVGSGKSTLMKFLANDPRTRAYLESHWILKSRNSLILSAFIWSAGLPSLQSQKGLFSTLLYQLFDGNRSAAKFYTKLPTPHIFRKTSPNDWSLSELIKLLADSLARVIGITCIFIDGLDEINHNENGGELGLLQSIAMLAKIPNVKVCVSSRPEPVFVNTLREYPHLRVQDLTARDIDLYVRDQLSYLRPVGKEAAGLQIPCSEPEDNSDQAHISKRQLQTLVNEIVTKANGVFVWVRIVVSRVQRGLIQYDTWEMLMKKIQGLPADLTKLYTAMWDRLGDDRQEYLQQAAFIFNHMKYLERPEITSRSRNTLLYMMFAADNYIRQRILGTGPVPNELELAGLGKIFYTRLVATTGSLLELVKRGTQDDEGAYTYVTQGRYEGHPPGLSKPQCNQALGLGFIHRSAHDFLMDTLDGKNILDADTKPGDEHQVLAFLAEMCFALIDKDTWYSPDMTSMEHVSERILPLFEKLFYSVGSGAGDIVAAVFGLIEATLARTSYEESHQCGFRPAHMNLDATTASNYEARNMQEHKIKTLVLLSFCTKFTQQGQFVVWLLAQGADPNYSGYRFRQKFMSPFVALLYYLRREVFSDDPEKIHPDDILRALHFIQYGAHVHGRVLCSLTADNDDEGLPFPGIGALQSASNYTKRTQRRHSVEFVVLVDLSISQFWGDLDRPKIAAAIPEFAVLDRVLSKADRAPARPILIYRITTHASACGNFDILESVNSKPLGCDVDLDEALLAGSRLEKPTPKMDTEINGGVQEDPSPIILCDRDVMDDFFTNYPSEELKARETLEWLVKKGYVASSFLQLEYAESMFAQDVAIMHECSSEDPGVGQFGSTTGNEYRAVTRALEEYSSRAIRFLPKTQTNTHIGGHD